MLNALLKEKSLSKYRLSKLSGIPYTTINDICSGKADIKNCNVDTIFKISKVLGVTIEELLEPYYEERPDFELFKSNICHRVKEKGDIDFMIDLYESNLIIEYFERKWYPESLYLLAMLDYLSRVNNVPVCSDYDDIRKCKLSKPVYPASVIALSVAGREEKAKEEALKEAIPEFLRHNIIEGEVRDVI